MKMGWRMALVAAFLTVPVFGQDSVSTEPVIGDALEPWDTLEQLNTFVVDTESFTSSWGSGFRIAPLVKSSKTSLDYLSSLISAQGMSNTLLLNVPFPFATYDFWDAPGFGVNHLWNNPGTPISPPGEFGNQFAVAFAEYGQTDDFESSNNIIGAVVNCLPDDPARLYVARITTAVNADSSSENRAQFGFGGVDSDGNAHFRGDGYGTTGPNPLYDNNYFRVDMLARDTSIRNRIDADGGSDAGATEHLLQFSPTTHGTPTVLPEQVAGRPVLMGSNFDNEYVYESTPGSLISTTAHSAPGIGSKRGVVAFSHRLTCVPGSVGTAGMLAYPVGTGSTTYLNLWGVDVDGNVVGNFALNAVTTYTPPGGGTYSMAGFDHYHSQTVYRGGNGQVAIGLDQQGRGLAAAVGYTVIASSPGPYDDPYNAIAVARWLDCTTPSEDWTLAAWIIEDATGPEGFLSTPILDGPGGAAIGRLAPLFKVTGGSPNGPSMSAPAIDSVGNIYFLASCELDDGAGGIFYTNGLLRAVYDPTDPTFDYPYELELLFTLGDVFHGQNSDTNWLISFMGIADSNSVDSGTLWSGNILQTAFNGADPADLETSDPLTLGGLVVSASIIYDVTGDGEYDDTLGVDEEYSVLLYIGPDAVDPCASYILGDANGDGHVDGFDIDAFVLALTNPTEYKALYGEVAWICQCDIDGDGSVTGFDIDPFVDLLTGG